MKPSQAFITVILASTLTAVTLSCGGGSGGGSGSGNQVPQGNVEVCTAEAFAGLTFDAPVALLQHPQDPGRWYVVERAGVVQTFTDGAAASDVFLDIRERVAAEGEGGLLGMALHPDFAANRLIYLAYTRPGDPLVSQVSAFTAEADGLTADPQSERRLLSVPQPFSNHNGGWIAFGPDGYLYISLGDGGGAGDPEGHAQNPGTLLGAVLRIDVNAVDEGRATAYAIPADNPLAASADCSDSRGCPEVYAYGFRNPWRGSFDSQTGDLWIGDVGLNDWEEIDRVEPGRNYGWPILEGNHCYDAATCDTAGLTPPVAEYGHGDGSSVTAGYVYRGSALPELDGDLIFGDFGSGQIWRLVDADRDGTEVRPLVASGLGIVAFGQDAAGELYVLDFDGGGIYRLAACASGVPRGL